MPHRRAAGIGPLHHHASGGGLLVVLDGAARRLVDVQPGRRRGCATGRRDGRGLGVRPGVGRRRAAERRAPGLRRDAAANGRPDAVADPEAHAALGTRDTNAGRGYRDADPGCDDTGRECVALRRVE